MPVEAFVAATYYVKQLSYVESPAVSRSDGASPGGKSQNGSRAVFPIASNYRLRHPPCDAPTCWHSPVEGDAELRMARRTAFISLRMTEKFVRCSAMRLRIATKATDDCER